MKLPRGTKLYTSIFKLLFGISLGTLTFFYAALFATPDMWVYSLPFVFYGVLCLRFCFASLQSVHKELERRELLAREKIKSKKLAEDIEELMRESVF